MSSHNELIDKISQKLRDWDYEIDRIEHKAIDLKDEALEKKDELLAEFRDKRTQLEQKLEEFEDVSEEVKKDLSDSLHTSWSSLELGLTVALQDVKEFLNIKEKEE